MVITTHDPIPEKGFAYIIFHNGQEIASGRADNPEHAVLEFTNDLHEYEQIYKESKNRLSN